MLFIRSLALYILPFTNLQVAKSHENDLNRAFGDNDLPQDSAFDQALHTALHTHLESKYQDGVYPDDRTAVARVREENPSLASRLLAAAKLEFVRRQADNSTTTATSTPAEVTTTTSTSQTPPPTTSTPATTSTPTTSSPDGGNSPTTTPPTTADSTTQGGGGGAGSSSGSTPSSETSAVVVPVDISTTDSNGQGTTISTSAVVASASVSAVVPVTTTNSNGDVVTSSSTVAGAIVASTNAAGQVVSSTIPVSSYKPEATTTPRGGINTVVTDRNGLPITLKGVTSGEVIRTTDAEGHTFVTTFTPGGGRISQLVLKTTTAADGRPVTLTSFVAAPSAVDSSSDGGSSPSNTGNPSLQSGLAAQPGVGRELLAVVGAGMLGAAALI